MWVVNTHNSSLGIVGHLTSYKKLIAYALGIQILCSSRQPGGAFKFVHGVDA